MYKYDKDQEHEPKVGEAIRVAIAIVFRLTMGDSFVKFSDDMVALQTSVTIAESPLLI